MSLMESLLSRWASRSLGPVATPVAKPIIRNGASTPSTGVGSRHACSANPSTRDADRVVVAEGRKATEVRGAGNSTARRQCNLSTVQSRTDPSRDAEATTASCMEYASAVTLPLWGLSATTYLAFRCVAGMQVTDPGSVPKASPIMSDWHCSAGSSESSSPSTTMRALFLSRGPVSIVAQVTSFGEPHDSSNLIVRQSQIFIHPFSSMVPTRHPFPKTLFTV
mmetsp:Transcript_76123/g.203462  ORF Transcript_76123/g.203462 Transcript_76123/m.203462 type:complete len:222 (-) Transcript_76123:1050-1715(-)